MNCDECKEQVFELIEREAVDPVGVREILERCPDCAALFAEIKAGLETAADLPLEAPSAAVDAAILGAAAARRGEVVPHRRKRSQPFPWAVAATALLAVGIGVWAMPRDADEAEPALPEAAMERSYDADKEVGADLAEEAILAEAEQLSLAGGQEPEAADAAKPAAQPPAAARAKRASKRAPAEMKLAMADDELADASRACEQKVQKLERRERDAKRGVDDAEDVLAIGRCYQAAGDAAKAREWLERAAEHPATRTRALQALRALAPD